MARRRLGPADPGRIHSGWLAYHHIMGTISTYLDAIEGVDRAALERVYAIASDVVPEAEEGTSYGMPALMYRGKGLISTIRARKFLSLYPFSGKVVAANGEVLASFEVTSGSVHYSVEHQLPDVALRRIVRGRRAEIDASISKH
jgi:uncharacterized protein YdhG (YjbR/CyaY superfamily)